MAEERRPPSRFRNLSYAAVAGLAGWGTVVLTVVALLIGLMLDSNMGIRGPFTIILLLASVPISLLVMARVAVEMTKRITPPKLRRRTTDLEEG